MLSINTDGARVLALLNVSMGDLAHVDDRLEAAAEVVYRFTRERFDQEGFGEWPPLAESTVARKAMSGSPYPERILFDSGDLYESATSPNGPYSVLTKTGDRENRAIHLIVDWDESGWQIPTLLSEGTENMPARPIWPDPHDPQLKHEIAKMLTATWIAKVQ